MKTCDFSSKTPFSNLSQEKSGSIHKGKPLEGKQRTDHVFSLLFSLDLGHAPKLTMNTKTCVSPGEYFLTWSRLINCGQKAREDLPGKDLAALGIENTEMRGKLNLELKVLPTARYWP